MTTINQAELIAINEAAKFLLSSNLKANKVHFYTDSLNCLQKLKKHTSNSKLTIETVTNFNKIKAKFDETFIHKVKAHAKICGNEIADELAKKGALIRPIGPEPFYYLANNHIEKLLLTKMKKKRTTKINSAKIETKNKDILKSYLKDNNPTLAHHNKNDIKNFTGIISGQNHLAHNENKLDKSVIPFCKHCPGTRETTEHYLGKCPAYSTHRLQVFQHTSLEFKFIIEEFSPKTICKFINLTGRLEEENEYYI